jgi:hypothetical protein
VNTWFDWARSERRHLGRAPQEFSSAGRQRTGSVCDVSDANREKRRATGARAYADAAEMFEQEKLDGVIICTPASVRLPLLNWRHNTASGAGRKATGARR